MQLDGWSLSGVLWGKHGATLALPDEFTSRWLNAFISKRLHLPADSKFIFRAVSMASAGERTNQNE